MSSTGGNDRRHRKEKNERIKSKLFAVDSYREERKENMNSKRGINGTITTWDKSRSRSGKSKIKQKKRGNVFF